MDLDIQNIGWYAQVKSGIERKIHMPEPMNERTVGQLVVERPGRARVFERWGIDYCCGGKKPLSLACRDKGLDAEAVRRELDELDASAPAPQRDWSAASLTELADHIEATHHASLKQELPRLEALSRKVAAVHGQDHPELLEIRKVMLRLKAEMESHILREELVLFPLCRKLETPAAREVLLHGSIQGPIGVMMREHDGAGDALAKLRRLTSEYTPPAQACNSYRALFDSLADLEADMHQHVHKENNILFPRAAQLEATLQHA